MRRFIANTYCIMNVIMICSLWLTLSGPIYSLPLMICAKLTVDQTCPIFLATFCTYSGQRCRRVTLFGAGHFDTYFINDDRWRVCHIGAFFHGEAIEIKHSLLRASVSDVLRVSAVKLDSFSSDTICFHAKNCKASSAKLLSSYSNSNAYNRNAARQQGKPLNNINNKHDITKRKKEIEASVKAKLRLLVLP